MGSKAKRAADEAFNAMAKHVADTMLLARHNVTAATPVDTEHAASNWVLSVGAPYTGVCGSREAVSYADQQAGDARMRAYSGRDLRANRRVHLTNNVFYLEFLNRGWSQQAPANFIALAILSPGATRHMPRGTKGTARRELRKIAHAALRGGTR